MAEKAPKLTEHTVLINGVEHTMLLAPEDVDRYELASKSKTPANKSREPQDK